MRLAHASSLEEFGSRSLLIHGIMVITFANAILVGLLVGGELGGALFLALLALTAGLWVAHSIHSLGNAEADGEYRGVLNELIDTGGSRDGFDTGDTGRGFDAGGPRSGFDAGRFGRLLSLIAVVTAISLLTSAQVFSGRVFSIVVVLVGAVALITAIVGVLIALGASYDAAQPRPAEA